MMLIDWRARIDFFCCSATIDISGIFFFLKAWCSYDVALQRLVVLKLASLHGTLYISPVIQLGYQHFFWIHFPEVLC